MFFNDINENLRLKLLTPLDNIDFFNLISKNREYLEYYMPRIKENKSEEDTCKVINIFLKQIVDNNGFRAGIIYQDKLIGIAGLKYIDWLNKKTEIMYWIDRDFQGQGITTKCVQKIIEIAFNYYHLNKVMIHTNINNKASIKIAEKCGFILEGIARKDELLSDGYADIYTYSILIDEYKKQ